MLFQLSYYRPAFFREMLQPSLTHVIAHILRPKKICRTCRACCFELILLHQILFKPCLKYLGNPPSKTTTAKSQVIFICFSAVFQELSHNRTPHTKLHTLSHHMLTVVLYSQYSLQTHSHERIFLVPLLTPY